MKQFSAITIAVALLIANCETLGSDNKTSTWNPCDSRGAQFFRWGSWNLWKAWCHKKDQSPVFVQSQPSSNLRPQSYSHRVTSCLQSGNAWVNSWLSPDESKMVIGGIGVALLSGYAISRFWGAYALQRNVQEARNARQAWDAMKYQATCKDYDAVFGKGASRKPLSLSVQQMTQRLNTHFTQRAQEQAAKEKADKQKVDKAWRELRAAELLRNIFRSYEYEIDVLKDQLFAAESMKEVYSGGFDNAVMALRKS